MQLDLTAVDLVTEVPIAGGAHKIDVIDFSQLGRAGIKHITALGLLRWLDAQQPDAIKDATTIVMESSGNAGVAMAEAVRAMDRQMIVVVKAGLESGKVDLLEEAGTVVRFAPVGTDPCQLADKLGQQPGYLEVNQYVCPGNWYGHRDVTGPLIATLYEDRGSPLPDCIVVATGSCGTLVGLDSWRKQHAPGVQLIAAQPEHGERIPGARDDRALQNVAFDWRAAADNVYQVSGQDAYQAALCLNERGLHVGPSSGLTAIAAERLLEQQSGLR